MTDLGIGGILVLNGGQIRGVFRERGLMKRVVLERLDPVREVMTKAVAPIDENASLEEALQAMEASHCRHLPVTRGARVWAFLSMRGLMYYELALAGELHHMRAHIHGSA